MNYPIMYSPQPQPPKHWLFLAMMIVVLLMILYIWTGIGRAEELSYCIDSNPACKQNKAEDYKYRGECAVCLFRFLKESKIHNVQNYSLCDKCYQEYIQNKKINLHPSRYCGVWCVHASTLEEIAKCPFKDKPSILYYSSAEEINWEQLTTYIIILESGGNPNAVSKKGCIGLMQISPMVLEEFNKNYGFPYAPHITPQEFIQLGYNTPIQYLMPISRYFLGIPEVNIMIGTWYLKRIWFYYLPHYKIPQTIDNLLWAYNAGVGNVVKGIKPKETKQYIKKYHKLTNGKK